MSLQDRVKQKQPSTTSKSFGETIVMGIKNKLMPLFKDEEDFKEFARSVVTVLDSDPTAKHPFSKCDPANVHRAILKAATFNLIPNLYDYCYMIPYSKSCKFEFGYIGLIELAKRTGNFKDIFANVVFSNDKIDIDLANGKIIHKPNLENRGKLMACYAIAEFTNGVKRIEVMGMDDFKKIKALSKNSAVVNKWESEFFRKSTLKRLTKTLPFSKEDRRDIVRGEDEPDQEVEEVVSFEEVEPVAIEKVEAVIVEPAKIEEPKKVLVSKVDDVKETEDLADESEKEEIAKAQSMADPEDPFADNPFEVGEY